MDEQSKRSRLPVRRATWLFLYFMLLPAWILQASTLQLSSVVWLDPPANMLEVGETTRVIVQIDGADNLYGAEVHLAFDASRVQILDADETEPGVQLVPGDFLPLDQGLLLANEADNVEGTLIYALTLLAPSVPVSGAGALVEFDLTTVAQGELMLLLDPVILASPDGMALPVLVEHGQITITASQATAVPTGIPIATSVPTAGDTPEVVNSATPSPQATNEILTPVEVTTDLVVSPTRTPIFMTEEQGTPTPASTGAVPSQTSTPSVLVSPEIPPMAETKDSTVPTVRVNHNEPVETSEVRPPIAQATATTVTAEAVAVIGQDAPSPDQLVTEHPSDTTPDPSSEPVIRLALLGGALILMVIAAWILLKRILTLKSGEGNDVN